MLGLGRLTHLLLELCCDIRNLPVKLFDFPLLRVFHERQFVLGRLQLSLHLRFLLIPAGDLRLERFYLVLQVVHVDFHLVLQL